MTCPRCPGLSLHEIVHGDITLDRCERCLGIWLERGELGKLLARGKDEAGSSRHSNDGDEDDVEDDDDDDGGARRRGSREGRRRSWWETVH